MFDSCHECRVRLRARPFSIEIADMKRRIKLADESVEKSTKDMAAVQARADADAGALAAAAARAEAAEKSAADAQKSAADAEAARQKAADECAALTMRCEVWKSILKHTHNCNSLIMGITVLDCTDIELVCIRLSIPSLVI